LMIFFLNSTHLLPHAILIIYIVEHIKCSRILLIQVITVKTLSVTLSDYVTVYLTSVLYLFCSVLILISFSF
jgi:hypothetical protein